MTSKEAMLYQLKSLKGKPLKQKLEHILTYFWIPIIITIVLLVTGVSYISHLVTTKDVALSIVCMNTYDSGNTHDEYLHDLESHIGIDPSKYDISITVNPTFYETETSHALDAAQLLLSQLATHSIDVITADPDTMTGYFYQEYFHPLDQILDHEQLKKYQDSLYYADMALIRQLRKEVYMPDVVFPDPTKPEAMIEPIAVALRIPADSDFLANYYPNSSKTVLIGLVVNSKNIDNALAFLNYTMQ